MCICFASNQYRADGAEMQGKRKDRLRKGRRYEYLIASLSFRRISRLSRSCRLSRLCWLSRLL